VLHFSLIVSVLVLILLVNGGFAVLNDHHLANELVFLLTKLGLLLLSMLLVNVFKVYFEEALALLDDSLLFLLSQLQRLAKLFQFDLLLFIRGLIPVELLLKIVSFVPQHRHLLIQLKELGVHNLLSKEALSPPVDSPVQFEIRLFLIGRELFVVLLHLVDGPLVLVALLVQIREVFPIFDFVALLLQAGHFFHGVLQLFLCIFDLVELSLDLEGLVSVLILIGSLFGVFVVQGLQIFDFDRVVLINQNVDCQI
jgi:hypothetical protein